LRPFTVYCLLSTVYCHSDNVWYYEALV
jgi:hypothetical protein